MLLHVSVIPSMLLTNIPLHGYSISLIHLPVNEHLDLFQVLSVANKATINNGLQVLWAYAFTSVG